MMMAKILFFMLVEAPSSLLLCCYTRGNCNDSIIRLYSVVISLAEPMIVQ